MEEEVRPHVRTLRYAVVLNAYLKDTIMYLPRRALFNEIQAIFERHVYAKKRQHLWKGDDWACLAARAYPGKRYMARAHTPSVSVSRIQLMLFISLQIEQKYTSAIPCPFLKTKLMGNTVTRLVHHRII